MADARTFENDCRENPSLQAHYVRTAYEDLKVVQDCLERLSVSRMLSMMDMQNALREAMQKEILRSSAHFEAAALLFAGLTPP